MEHLQKEAVRQGKKVKVHLMVDTGMGRLGVGIPSALDLIRRIHLCSHLELDGICTHLSSVYGQADEDRDFTRAQIERFREMVATLNGAASGRDLLIHVQNSGVLYTEKKPVFNMVRPGAAIYGLGPMAGALRHLGIEPVLSVRTQVIFLKDVPSGTPISYDRSYVTRRPSRIATLPLGYNDGFRYHLSNRAQVLLKGQFVPVVGKVTMDYTMIDVTEVPDVGLGDVVTLVGSDGANSIEIPELAQMLNTVPFEVTCGLGRRVRRIYRGAGGDTPAEPLFRPASTGSPAVA
jgi:alanine racemase